MSRATTGAGVDKRACGATVYHVLLGARTILTGISPQVARTIVELGPEAGRHETVAALLAVLFRCFHLVAQRHQFIDLGDDAVLFGEGWKRERYCLKI